VKATEKRVSHFFRICCDGRVNAGICRRSASRMVHHGRWVEGQLLKVAGEIVKVGGLAVNITQCLGRGAFSPTSTRIVWAYGRVSKLRTASFAAASARSFPRMRVCPRI